MNDKEQLEFFNQVKGKKIRHSSWYPKQYFVPKQYLYNDVLSGTFFNLRKGGYGCAKINIYNGFNPCNAGWFWEFYNEDEQVCKICNTNEIDLKDMERCLTCDKILYDELMQEYNEDYFETMIIDEE